MKLWRISQEINTEYDTFDSAVVAAESEEDARRTHPQEIYKNDPWWEDKIFNTWTHPDHVAVEYIGEAKEGTPAGVICASFNAG